MDACVGSCGDACVGSCGDACVGGCDVEPDSRDGGRKDEVGAREC